MCCFVFVLVQHLDDDHIRAIDRWFTAIIGIFDTLVFYCKCVAVVRIATETIVCTKIVVMRKWKNRFTAWQITNNKFLFQQNKKIKFKKIWENSMFFLIKSR